jgi:hypothetical protein
VAAAVAASLFVWQSLHTGSAPLSLLPRLPGFANETIRVPPPGPSAGGAAIVSTAAPSSVPDHVDHPAAGAPDRGPLPVRHARPTRVHRSTPRRPPPAENTPPSQPPATGSQPVVTPTPAVPAEPAPVVPAPTPAPATRTQRSPSVPQHPARRTAARPAPRSQGAHADAQLQEQQPLQPPGLARASDHAHAATPGPPGPPQPQETASHPATPPPPSHPTHDQPPGEPHSPQPPPAVDGPKPPGHAHP